MSRAILTFLLTNLVFASTTIAAESAAPTRLDRLTAAAAEHRLRLDHDGGAFSGPGWDRLVAGGSAAQFFLVGEEHGIAENPKLVAALFSALTAHGYARLAIEISPTMAWRLDAALQEDGLDGLHAPGMHPCAAFRKINPQIRGMHHPAVIPA